MYAIRSYYGHAKSICLNFGIDVPRGDRNERIVAGLDDLARETGLYKPEEDHMPIVLEPVIARYLVALGIDAVTIADEFHDETQPRRASDFAPGAAPVSLRRVRVSSIVSDAPGLLIAWSHHLV